MRVTVSHTKSQEEVMKVVDRSIEDTFRGLGVGLVQVSNTEKTWNGNTMTFSMQVKAAFLTTPVHGTVLVNERDVVIEADLGLFGKFISDEKAATLMEGRIKGLIGQGQPAS
jgi:hypothetical protein